MIPRIAENSIGICFVVQFVDECGLIVDVSDATTKNIIFDKPDDTDITKVATFTTDGTDGKIQVASEAGELTPAGTDWEIQGKVITPSGTFYSSPERIIIFANLA